VKKVVIRHAPPQWRLPQEGKLALLFVNVSDQLVTVTVAFDGRTYGFQQPMVTVTALRAEGKGRGEKLPVNFRRPLPLPPRTALAWEIASR
jgi:hypothetical protein